MKLLTIKEIQEIFKRSNLDEEFCLELSRLLDLYMITFKLDTPMRRVRFLAQAIAETGIKRDGTVRVRENLNYSTKGLMQLSRHFRRHPKLASKYGRNKFHKANQRAIANIWYADKNRAKHLRLGNNKEGDGFLYRGAGLFQSTGRENITKDLKHIEKHTGIRLMDSKGNLYPDILSNYTMSVMLGIAHWHRTRMWKLKSTTEITNKINRGLPISKKRERVANAYHVMDVLKIA